MKFSIFVAFVATLQISATGYSQYATVNVHLKNAGIVDVFNEIERQSEYKIFYKTANIDKQQVITIDKENITVDVLLNTILDKNHLSYEMIDKVIVITPIVQQGITITGTVMDENNVPIPGVNVVIKGTTIGIITDASGKYSINVPDNDVVLVFSFVGYETAEFVVGNQRTINVELRESVSELEEVVVIGYGTVRKRDLTGAVSTIKGTDLNYAAAVSVGHTLMGKAAGITVLQNSAQPGGGLNVLIRGAGSVNAGNSPLYVVDGFPIITYDQPGADSQNRLDPGRQGNLNFINLNDIASMEIMKDASATAIYGSRAANGVVLITTHRGKEGKPMVSFSATYGIQKVTDNYDLLPLNEWMQERNSASYNIWLNRNSVSPFGTNTLENAIQNPINGIHYVKLHTDEEIRNAGKGTDWLSEIMRNGKVAEYNLNLQGGTAATKYMVSLGYHDTEGVIKNSRLQRYTGRLNFDQDIGKYVKSVTSFSLARLNSDNIPLGGNNWEAQGMIRSALVMNPNITVKNPDGSYRINPLRAVEPNPVSLLERTDNTITDRVIADEKIIIEPIKDLQISLFTGIDFSSLERGYYDPTVTVWGGNLGGHAQIRSNKREQYRSGATVNYKFDLNPIHQFDVLAGYEFEKTKIQNRFLENNNFIIDAFIYQNIGAGTGTRNVTSSASENKMASYFGRINYTLLNRYLFTATLRADGASVFARNHKWGYFPSVAVGWNMLDENFMAFTRSSINMLKWRVSWGQTGNSNIGSNAFAAYTTENAWDTEDGTRIVGVRPSRLENPNLKWETTTEWNIGLDVSFSVLNGISVTFEYYDRIISDLLQEQPLNRYQYIGNVWANVGKTQSRGFEITLNTRNVTKENFTWSTDYTFTVYRDNWLERAPDWIPNVYQKAKDPVRAIHARKALRILQIGDPVPDAQPLLKPGEIVIADINGNVRDDNGNPVSENGIFLTTGKPDGRIDDADTRLMGSRDPGYYMGLVNRMTYRGFDLNFSMVGFFDRMIQDPTFTGGLMSPTELVNWGYNQLRAVKDRWTPTNPSTTIRSYLPVSGQSYGNGDWYWEKAWYIRMQNISLGYTLPRNILSNVFSSFRVHFDVNNVFVITPYKGLDPETDYEQAAYPNARTFSFGIDLKF